MFKNYLKIAWRNIKRDKTYTIINLTGLVIGLTACLLIGLYVRHELSYDRFFPNADQTYQVIRQGIAQDVPGLARVMARQFPEIEHTTVVNRRGKVLFNLKKNNLYIDRAFQTDSAFFSVFPYKLLKGNPRKVLAGPGKMVITQSLAKKLFGSENPMGKTVRIESRKNYTITGVMENPPDNVDFRPKVLLSLSQSQRKERYGGKILWRYYGGYHYIVLNPGSDPKLLQYKMNTYKKAHAPDFMEDQKLRLLPITDIHLYASDVGGEITPQSNIRYIYFFLAIAIALLIIIASINYVNLSTARALQRAKEVGIRKTVGAQKKQLILQFLGESMLLVAAALPLTLILTHFLLPLINKIAGTEIILWASLGLYGWLILIGFFVLIGFLAGLYPALYLSGFRPIEVLAGRGGKNHSSQATMRKGLIVFQFVVSIILIVSTIVVKFQLNYVNHKDLGFDKEHVVTFSAGKLGKQYTAFKQAILQHTDILAATSGPPPGLGRKNMTMSISDSNSTQKKWLIFLNVDYGYPETLKFHLKAGRFFSPDHPGDATQAVILNEAAVKYYKLDKQSIGQAIKIRGKNKKLIGIIKNYNNASLYGSIQPLVLSLHPGNNFTALVRLAPGKIQAGLNILRKTWKQFLPDRPFRFSFLNDRIEAQYQSSRRLGSLFELFSGLAILIACLGIFGLAAYSTQRRTKEIGIRKVLGATILNITNLLNKDFLKLVLIGFIVAVPIGWYFMHRWLQNFAYKINLSPWIFILAGALAVIIALAAVSWQSIRAALANPVDSLRSE